MSTRSIHRLPLAAAILLWLLLISACDGDGDGDERSTMTPAATATPAAATATAVRPTATAVSSPIASPTIVEPSPAPATPTPPTTGPSAVFRRIESTDAVFLTFDAGAERGYAAQIVDLLAAEGITASFGITGRWAEQNPDIVRRVVDSGHTLINHSWDHASFTGTSWDHVALTYEDRAAQLERAEIAFAAAAPGTTAKPYWRPPFGDYDASVLADAGAEGYAYTIMWQIDSGGWRGLTGAEVAARVLAAQPGDIVVLHVAAPGDYDALPQIIDGLRARGLRLAPLHEALR